MWALLPADVKDRTPQAVSRDIWQTAMPPNTLNDYVVAYGYRSGKCLQDFAFGSPNVFNGWKADI